VSATRKPHEGRKVRSTFYNTRLWRKTSKAFLAENPYCAPCHAQGRVALAKVTDHIKPINPVDAYDTKNSLYGEPLDPANFQPMCVSCHAKKSGKESHKHPYHNDPDRVSK
jgi:5-methylcytosine-specific restriction protein A